MDYPYVTAISESQEMTTYFNGYNHTHSCPEGAFFNAKNITADEYPILAPRRLRGINRSFTNFQGIVDKEELIFVDDGVLYINNEAKDISLSNEGSKTLATMGAYLVIMPDKVWYNVEDNAYGNLESFYDLNGSVSFTLCGMDGSAITWHDSSYYESHTPSDGDYMMSTINGKTSLKVYSSGTSLWSSVPTTYVKIAATGIGKGFEKEDGVKISIDLTGISWDYAENIFVNVDEDNENIRFSNFAIYDKGDDYITIPALLNANQTFSTTIKVSREVPDMSFITECQNRLWGCAKDGHEVYCCKLGDVKNWNCFAGISTDSWAATIGTDGKFTGAYSYLGYPIFFKEDSLIRITISSQGAHQTKDIRCRGVQAGSEKSLCMVNELLYYKSGTCVCSYDGQFPQEISQPLGDVVYRNAVAGVIGNKYYISMESDDGYSMFVFDAYKKIWTREDNTQVTAFCKHSDELYFVSGNILYSVNGGHVFEATESEKDISWMVESGAIGYALAEKKNFSRFNIRIQLENTSYASLMLQYDSEGDWINAWQIHGKGTQTFTIPVRPHRCDHFRFKIIGHGKARIYSITKYYTKGSDV